ncbi:hypothetical protein UA08_01398 [Talaromyces atroroseus]|uniref:NADH:flavin oxidoreductase/NADH oxidase N-terminal domain-containing protein n=1 Tax=Talaromyces atroroseus TaxID=1441469 RepID=A0A1Q5QB05_TALAT|nr:hypothetical protein UA08_01398 [Talaromyces atroroseus]OKL63115.1 hypothetical protein UA08_01398 [Talaromyces atroroseus]
MTIEDIKEVVSQFSHAARLAIEVAGFDDVEIHGANGYPLDSFTHDNINKRTDEYGGPVEGRLKFALEVIDGVIGAIESDRAAIRLAPYHVLQETNDSNRIDTFAVLSAELEKRQLANGSHPTEKSEIASIWPFRRILRTTPVIGAGGYGAESAAQAIHEGRIDLAAFGRHFTSNPDLPERLFHGYPLTKYHRPTFYTSGLQGYLGWSRWGEEEAAEQGSS